MGRPLHSQQQQQQRVQPFLPPGRGSSPEVLLRSQLPDLLAALDAALSKDWPRSFIKVRKGDLLCQHGAVSYQLGTGSH